LLVEIFFLQWEMQRINRVPFLLPGSLDQEKQMPFLMGAFYSTGWYIKSGRGFHGPVGFYSS
jgi:hypothetical protein